MEESVEDEEEEEEEQEQEEEKEDGERRSDFHIYWPRPGVLHSPRAVRNSNGQLRRIARDRKLPRWWLGHCSTKVCESWRIFRCSSSLGLRFLSPHFQILSPRIFFLSAAPFSSCLGVGGPVVRFSVRSLQDLKFDPFREQSVRLNPNRKVSEHFLQSHPLRQTSKSGSKPPSNE